MRPYGERPTGNACSCCNVLRGGDDGHKRTAERMHARAAAQEDLLEALTDTVEAEPADLPHENSKEQGR